MMDEFISNFVEVRAEKKQKVLSVKFLKFIPYPDFLKAVEQEYELIRNHYLRKCMIDLRLISVYDNGMPEYVNDVWFPTVQSLGVRYIAFVVPEAVLGQMSMNRAHKNTEANVGMNVEHFKDIKGAMDWLQKC
jgi:hypothetical protein